jgi:acyl carrier protein
VVPEAEITMETGLDTQLQMDSLDTVEFCLSLGDEFDIVVEPKDIHPRTVARLVELLSSKLSASS